MKTNLLIILMAALLSGCGIFRKSEKHKLDVKSSVEVEQSVITAEQKKEVENSQRQKSTTTDKESNSQTTVEADEIVINPDGSIAAKGNVKASQNRNDTDKSKGEESEAVSKETATDRSLVDHTKSVQKEETSSFEKIPEKATNPIWHWIGGALFVCILLFFGWKVLLKR